jgi:hypothetical protein
MLHAKADRKNIPMAVSTEFKGFTRSRTGAPWFD